MENQHQTVTDSLRGEQDGRQPLRSFEAASLWELFDRALSAPLKALLSEYLRTRRWFRGKARSIREIEIVDRLRLRAVPDEVILVLVRISYAAEDGEVYVLPLAQAAVGAERAAGLPHLCALQSLSSGLVVYDPSSSEDFSQLLLDLFTRAQTPGEHGAITATPTAALAQRAARDRPRARQSTGEQSNTTVFFGHEFMLKVFRQLEYGENPDLEIIEFLWARGYRHIPEPLGSVRYEGPALIATLGIAQRFVPSEALAWDASLQIVERSLGRLRAMNPPPSFRQPGGDPLDDIPTMDPEIAEALVEPYTHFARLLGERTAELHLSLASDPAAAFAPEPFTGDYQRSLLSAVRGRIDRAFALLTNQLARLPAEVRPLADDVFVCRTQLDAELTMLESMHIRAHRIRCHGDYHLGQVLYGDGDFVILDFEGEPAQSIEMRRRKGSALYDVSGMLRSFHYAATVASQSNRWPRDERSRIVSWSEAWYRWASATFLAAYVKRARAASAVFLPESVDELRALLRVHLIDKCCYELSYELNNRPAWVSVPMAGLRSLVRAR
jgi:maltose alpha-D-glucosyltransferase / alpha-amylase